MRKKVLIAEDDANTLFGLVEIVSQEGYDVVGAENASKAIAALRLQRFNLLLTDLRMPDLSGIELHKHALLLSPGIKTILMSAYGTPRDILEAQRTGVFEYLTKPLDLDRMFAVLDAASSATGNRTPNVVHGAALNQASNFAW